MAVVAAVGLAVSAPVRADRHTPTLPVTELNADGMYVQKWW